LKRSSESRKKASLNERPEIPMNIIHEKEQLKYHRMKNPVPADLLDLRSFSSTNQIQLQIAIAELNIMRRQIDGRKSLSCSRSPVRQ
jgi:hypothetical protein